MEKDRLLAFSDGVIAVIITIMVLELKAPHEASLDALAGAAPVFLSYVLSFIYVAIYWNNHHHFFHLVRRVNGAMLWANLHLLFWLSLIPFATSWMGEHSMSAVPAAVYGGTLLMSAIAWNVMQTVIIRSQGAGSPLAQALGHDIKGKLSLACYVASILLSFIDTRIADAIFALVALMWLVPDRRIERAVRQSRND
jgi:TMEM175 potassium channel family protein